MITEKNKEQIEYMLNIFDSLKKEAAFTLSQIEDKQEKEIYNLTLDLLFTLNKLESEYEEIGKLRCLIDQDNIRKEIEAIGNEDPEEIG